jgi:hypothetical protein
LATCVFNHLRSLGNALTAPTSSHLYQDKAQAMPIVIYCYFS